MMPGSFDDFMDLLFGFVGGQNKCERCGKADTCTLRPAVDAVKAFFDALETALGVTGASGKAETNAALAAIVGALDAHRDDMTFGSSIAVCINYIVNTYTDVGMDNSPIVVGAMAYCAGIVAAREQENDSTTT